MNMIKVDQWKSSKNRLRTYSHVAQRVKGSKEGSNLFNKPQNNLRLTTKRIQGHYVALTMFSY